MEHGRQTGSNACNRGRWQWALAGLLAVAAFFLWTEHRAHLLGALPLLLFLACPLMHLFHHGHGGASHSHGRQTAGPETRPSSPPDASARHS